jgi:phosphoribosyl 1,2-cyclic phosphodiesterase
MRIRFWGVRGSIPAPILPLQIKSRISAVLERVTPEDIENPDSRERFLADLPPWLFGVVGGNTSCVSVSPGEREDLIIFDAGSGIRELGLFLQKNGPRAARYRLFFSHFHWDHLQGLPFFKPAYDPEVSLDIYSPFETMEGVIKDQMKPPYFPVTMDALRSKKNFHIMKETLALGGGVSISYKKMSHPGDCYAFQVHDGKSRVIYATDTELSERDFIGNGENTAFFKNADLIILDAQYTLVEALEKTSWGHNAFSMAVDFAGNWGIKHLVLFHHDPAYDDKKLLDMAESARIYAERTNRKGIEITPAMEGMEIVI